MSSQPWFETQRYKDFIKVHQSMDFAERARLLEAALRETTGPERLFWLRCRLTIRLQTASTRPRDAEAAWRDLEELLAGPQDSVEDSRYITMAAIGLYVTTERRDLWAPFFPRVLPHLRRAVRLHIPWHGNMGNLRLRQGQWRKAFRHYTKAIAGFHALTPAQQHGQRGILIFMHAGRAIASVACGHLDAAVADLSRAVAVDSEFKRGFAEPYPLARAQAKVALAMGDFAAARSAVQEGIARSAVSQYKPRPYDLIKFDLIAARMARAEGNSASFHHFCNEALSLSQEWSLPWSEARVRAVLAGAER
jgi:tetratricopeptide (TPR) repeat protein